MTNVIGVVVKFVLFSEPIIQLHPAVFRSSLRRYQLQGVQWMQQQELQREGGGGLSQEIHPMWDEFEFPIVSHESSTEQVPVDGDLSK